MNLAISQANELSFNFERAGAIGPRADLLRIGHYLVLEWSHNLVLGARYHASYQKSSECLAHPVCFSVMTAACYHFDSNYFLARVAVVQGLPLKILPLNLERGAPPQVDSFPQRTCPIWRLWSLTKL